MKIPYRKTLLLTALALSLLTLQCAVNPVTKQWDFMLISSEKEVEIGREADPEITEQYGYYEDERLQNYINNIGQKLVSICDRKDISYHFAVVDSPEINAFALPGGYIYITRGILAQFNSEAELASVMGHELGHITARHSAKQISAAIGYQIIATGASIIYPEMQQWSQIMGTIFSAIENGYGRSYELQSDELGIKYNSNAGYNPKASASFLRHLKMNEKGKKVFHGLMSTHPETEERITKAEAKANEILRENPGKQFIDGRDTYFAGIEGLAYGPGEKNGIFDGRTYKNGFYRFAVSTPSNWKEVDSRYLFTFKHPEKDMFISLARINLRGNLTAEQLAQKWENSKKIRRISGKELTIDSINAYRALYAVKSNKGKASIEMLFFVRKGTGFAIVGSALDKEFKDAVYYFNTVFNSLRLLTNKEAELVKNRNIRIYTVKSGDTVSLLAEQYFKDKTKDEEIALINGFDKNRLLIPGEKIKIPMLQRGNNTEQ